MAPSSANLARMPKEQIEIHLRYEGPDVDDGSMSVEDIVPVLQGFSSAYGKLASEVEPSATHRIKIVGVRPGSADIVLEAWKYIQGDGATNAITNIGVLGGGAYWIVKKIIGVLQLKRHVKKRPFVERITVNNTISVSNSDNVTIEVPLEIYETFKAGTLDKDLSRITRPLVKGRIDAAEIEAKPADGTVLRERVTAEERPYFDVEEVTVTTTKETWLEARLTQVNKNTNSGYVHLADGHRVFFRFVGENPHQLYSVFAHDGPVRILCVAYLDESLRINTLDIHQIERMQRDLFDFAPPEPEDDE